MLLRRHKKWPCGLLDIQKCLWDLSLPACCSREKDCLFFSGLFAEGWTFMRQAGRQLCLQNDKEKRGERRKKRGRVTTWEGPFLTLHLCKFIGSLQTHPHVVTQTDSHTHTDSRRPTHKVRM